MKKISKHNKKIFIAISVFISSSLFADEWHYNNIIIGERATGMGGAYTAISDDPSGLFHNPAGIVYGGKRNLSASVNAFSLTSTTYKGVLGGRDWERESSSLLPNFFGVTQPFAGGVIGFSYAVTDSISEDQDSIFNGIGSGGTGIRDFVINVNNIDNTYKLGPSFAYEVNDELSVGMTLYFHVRDQELITNQWKRFNNDEAQWANSYYQSSENGFEPVLGFMWSPFEKVSLGLAVRQVVISSSETSSQSICLSTIPNANETNVQCQDPVGDIIKDPAHGITNQERDMPLQVNVGMAYFSSNTLLVSGDLAYFGKTDTAESVVNIALGAEYYINESWAFRGGFYTNFSNSAEIVSTATDQPDHVDIYGLTFSASHFTRDSSITLGLSYSFGSGDAQVIAGDATIQDVDVSALTFFVSSSLSY